MKDAVSFLLKVDDGQAEVFECATCQRPETYCPVCPIDDQPVLMDAAAFYMVLQRHCETYHALPGPGGVMDQDRRIMRWFDVIQQKRHAAAETKNAAENEGGSE